MQFPDDADLAAAIANPERIVDALVEFDWNRDGTYSHQYADLSWLVTDAIVDTAAITGNLPEQVNTVVGYSSAELTLRLGGTRFGADLDAEIAALLNDEWNEALATQGMTAEQLFSPYWTPSPLYGFKVAGTPVRYWRIELTATGDRVVRQFTGHVRSFQIDRVDRSVQVIASDVLTLQNAPVTLPMWARVAYPGDALAGCSRPIETGWAVEECFRQASIPTGPVARADAVAYWSCNGSLLPSVGTISDGHAEGEWAHSLRWQTHPLFVNGLYGLAPNTTGNTPTAELDRHRNVGLAITPRAVTVPPDNATAQVIGFAAWVYVDTTTGFTGTSPYNDTRQMRVFLSLWRAHDTTNPENYASNPLLGTGEGTVDEHERRGVCFYVAANGAWRAEVRHGGTTIGARWGNSTALTTGWHYIDLRVRFTSTTLEMVSATIDDTPGTWSTLVAPTGPFIGAGSYKPGADLAEFMYNAAVLYTGITCQHVQLFADTSTGIAPYTSGQGLPPKRDSRPLAKLPAGTTGDLTWIPDVFQQPAWEVLKEIAASELAIVHTDEFGTVSFVPNYQARVEADNKLARDMPTITDDNLLGFMVNPTEDQYRNIISIGYTEKFAETGTIWSLQNWRRFTTPENFNQNEWHPVDNLIAVNTKKVATVHTTLGTDPNYTHNDKGTVNEGVAVYAEDSSTYAPYGWLLRPRADETRRRGFWMRRFTDDLTASYTAIQYTKKWASGQDDFTPFAYVGGMTYGPSESSTVESRNDTEIAAFGERILTLPASDWRSFKDSAELIADSLLGDTTTPAPVVDGVEIPSDPRLQLRDVVRLRSEDGITGAIFAQIIGIRRHDGANGSTDTLTMRVLRTPGEWILGDPDLSILGQTTILGAGA